MGDNKDLKPRSFRVSEETQEKFKIIAEQIGGNQDETLARLIDVYETQGRKVALPDKKESIERFEQYISCLSNLFMGSLEDLQTTEERVRTQFARTIKMNEDVIVQLQENLKNAQESESGMKEKVTELENLYADAQKKVTSLEQTIADKNELNISLRESVESYKLRLEELIPLAEQIKELHQLRSENETLKADIKNQKLEYEYKLLELEKKNFMDLMEQKNKKQTSKKSKKEEEEFAGKALNSLMESAGLV